jgi:hypothetical protein
VEIQMKPREAQAFLVRHTGYTAGEIDQRMRPLRNRKLIASGPRGLGALELEPLEAALMLLSLVSRRGADAGPIMARAMDLEAVTPPDAGKWPLADVGPLAPILAAALTGRALIFDRIEILCDGSMAWVDFSLPNYKRRVLFTDDAKVSEWVAEFPDAYDAQGAMALEHRMVITGDLVKQFALELVDEPSVGYVGAEVGATYAAG